MLANLADIQGKKTEEVPLISKTIDTSEGPKMYFQGVNKSYWQVSKEYGPM